MPLEPEHYSFAEVTGGNVTVYTMTLNTQSVELYSFAVWGRYFPTDGQVEDPPREDDLELPVTEESVAEDDADEDRAPDAADMPRLNSLITVAVMLVVRFNM